MERPETEALMKYLYDPPQIVKKLFSDFEWNTVNQKILLTFDDGPNPGTTEIILESLERAGLKTVFFCVGNNIKLYPDLVAQIVQQGHTIGNHTYNHSDVIFIDRNKLQNEIIAVNDLMSRYFNYPLRYFRPPHGRFGVGLSRQLNDIGMKNVMWSLLTFDYKNDLNIVKFTVKKYLRNDSIIVLHDSRKSKDIIRESIEFILQTAEIMGYEIGVPEECLR